MRKRFILQLPHSQKLSYTTHENMTGCTLKKIITPEIIF